MTPSKEALAHSQKVQHVILEKIRQQNGLLSFTDYMQTCLYEPGLGYYTAGCEKFGSAGDFTTAPTLSPLFPQALAKQWQQIQQLLPRADLLEFGAGTGAMAAGILNSLSTDELPRHYYIMEVSADLRQRQQAYLTQHCPELIHRVIWLDTLPESFNGLILANEVLDAMPVELFHLNQDGGFEIFVTSQEERLTWQKQPTDKYNDLLPNLPTEVLSQGYTSEINPAIHPWVKSLADILQQGIILLIDYGFPEAEYYHPSRNRGTLMCHFQHHSHPDPLLYPGIQDITAHVNFTDVARAAVAHDLEPYGYCDQAKALLSLDILELVENITDETERFNANQQLKLLTLPHEMGELFKFIAFGKGIEEPLKTFTIQDSSYRL